MLGAASLRSVLKDVRVSALRCPHHLDDLRFLLSLRRPNDFGAVYRMAASTHAPNSSAPPKATSMREIPTGNESLSMASTFASATGDEAASLVHLGMAMDSHALYLECIGNAMRAARRRSRVREERQKGGELLRLATLNQRVSGAGQPNADEPKEKGARQDKDSVEKTERSEERMEDVDGVFASDFQGEEEVGIVHAEEGNSDPNVEATRQYFWLKKRLTPLSIAPLSSSAPSTFAKAEREYGNGTATTSSSCSSSSPQTSVGPKTYLSGSKVIHPSTGDVFKIPYSACEMGFATDVIHRQSVDAFPFAREFLFSSENDKSNASSLAIRDIGKGGDAENVHVDSPLFSAYDFILSEKCLQSHTVAGASAADEFLFSVHTCAVEPYYKPPPQDLLAVGTEDEVDIGETTLPRYEIAINFIMSGRHTHQSKIAIVNTHFFVLECNQPTSPLAPASVALVEHVGLLDARSLLALPSPPSTSSSSSPTANGGDTKMQAKGAAVRQRVGAVQQHTLSLRLATAEGPGCVGALKGRIFYKIGGIDEDICEAPVRCIEFGPVALREDDHE